jgi:hypothetical protein
MDSFVKMSVGCIWQFYELVFLAFGEEKIATLKF